MKMHTSKIVGIIFIASCLQTNAMDPEAKKEELSFQLRAEDLYNGRLWDELGAMRSAVVYNNCYKKKSWLNKLLENKDQEKNCAAMIQAMQELDKKFTESCERYGSIRQEIAELENSGK